MEINKNKSKQPYLIGFFLILILPLLNIPPLFSPPDWGKTIIFRIILSFLIFLSLYHIFFQKNNAFSITIKNKLYEIIKKKLLPFWLLISFLLLLFLATIFSLNPSFSFWGSPYRAGGFLNSLFYVIFSVLAFLILKKNDWKKIWNFSFIIGILVALIAIFQQFNLFSNILISDPTRPASTVGGPIFLAIYLLLLSFLALSFGLKEKNSIKKLFYLSTVAFFLFTIILITQTRAAFIGLTIGFLWFLLFYPIFSKKLTYLKISFIIILLLAAFGVFYINTRSKLPRFFEENKVLNNFTQRLSISNALSDVRFSGWIILSKAVKSKPLLGYGPENLSIGFDKYYNLSIPNLTYSFGPGTGWWDRAHNFVFDISVTSGIPTLLIYLLLLSTIFWQLQKLKKKNPPESIIYHGIQATLIAYVATNFLSFDTFSTYLIFFLLISYSLFLIFEQENTTPIISNERLTVYPYRKITIAILLFIPMIWFIWEYNIKPLQINKEINWANYYSKNKKYEQSIEKIEGILESHSFLDHYIRLQYTDIIGEYIKRKPEKKIELAEKAIELLKENTEIRPYYTRNWLSLASYTNILIANGQNELKDDANYYLEKAYELSPGHQEIFIEWAKTHLLTKEYKKAKEKAQECINLNPKPSICWWYKGLAQISLNEIKQGKESIKIAEEKEYIIDSEKSLLELANAYIENNNYQELLKIYKELIILKPKNYQYHGSLATVYKELGMFEKAKEEALKIIRLKPEARNEVNIFIKSLR